MKTKAQIVQELLNKKEITAEEAVTLLEPQIIYQGYPVLTNPVPTYVPVPYPMCQPTVITLRWYQIPTTTSSAI